jgi:hypothetical protein
MLPKHEYNHFERNWPMKTKLINLFLVVVFAVVIIRLPKIQTDPTYPQAAGPAPVNNWCGDGKWIRHC